MSTTAEHTQHPPLIEQINTIRKRALIAGVVAIAVCAIALFTDPRSFFTSYLVGYTYWWQFAVGGLGLVLLHQLVGGNWGVPVRPILSAATSTMLPLAVLAVPIYLGVDYIFPWTNPEYIHSNHLLEQKTFFLNKPFFVMRAPIYFGIWLFLGFTLNTATKRQMRATGLPNAEGLKFISGIGLLALFLSATFASFDWIMSLDPLWYSTIYGALVIVGGGVSMFALCAAVAALLPFQLKGENNTIYSAARGTLGDLGTLLLAFIMLWTYFAFSQYLIIWNGDLPEEISWYMIRREHGWAIVSFVIGLFHFVVPFFCLMSREFKETPKLLGGLALGILVMRLVDVFWNIVPSLERTGFQIAWTDPFAVVGIGGLWTAAFLWKLPSFLNDDTLKAPRGLFDLAAINEEEHAHD